LRNRQGKESNLQACVEIIHFREKEKFLFLDLLQILTDKDNGFLNTAEDLHESVFIAS
jgi:hypothetical protein